MGFCDVGLSFATHGIHFFPVHFRTGPSYREQVMKSTGKQEIQRVVFTLLFARIAARIANRVDPVKLSRMAGVVMVGFSAVILVVNYLL